MLSRVGLNCLLATLASARPSFRSAQISCPVVLSGQVPASAQLAEFDSSSSLFNPEYVRASAIPWSQILLFPNVTNSRFDGPGYKSVEVTINQSSIFQTQNGFRRAGLLLANDTNDQGPGTTGVRTLHWSVKQDPSRTLNLTHEYLVRISRPPRGVAFCELYANSMGRMSGMNEPTITATSSTLRLGLSSISLV
jgi:hypothetical protein